MAGPLALGGAAPRPPRWRRWAVRVWVAVGALGVALWAVLAAVAPEAGVTHGLLGGIKVWVVPTVCGCLLWVWRRLTYRVSVRLFISYLLVGVTPIAVFALLGVALGYAVVGQYTASRCGDELERARAGLSLLVDDALGAVAVEGRAGAAALLGAGAVRSGVTLPAPRWIVAEGGRVWREKGSGELAPPTWSRGPHWSGIALVEGMPALAAVGRRNGRTVAVVLPLDVPHARALSNAAGWYEVRFVSGGEDGISVVAGSGGGISLTPGGGTPEPGPTAAPGEVPVGTGRADEAEVEPGWTPAGLGPGGLLRSRWVVWSRAGEVPRRWEDGESEKDRRVLAVVKTSPLEAYGDFLRSPSPPREDFRTLLIALGATFASLYGLAVLMAAVMIVSITRSTARLTRGAREVARGNLTHRIPVKRRDQLGDLAVSFNAMTEAVEGMLVQVAEKERMARELELAREIQRSLVPRERMRHGVFELTAHFRPAAEVGGDYFDVFPLSERRLIVAIGDVAGHGIGTGLLMAGVKATVATLVDEGYRGAALLERLNALLRAQPRGHRMVTMAIAEVDGESGVVEVVSAGHPPPLVATGRMPAEEILLGALPLGYEWHEAPAVARRPFPPGSTLVLYSDGLVEARNATGRAFGSEGVAGALAAPGSRASDEVAARIIRDWEAHLDGLESGDDATLLVVGLAPGGAVGENRGEAQ